MKPLFEILPSGIEAEHCILVCEINKDCFCYAINDTDKNMCMAVAVYSFDPLPGEELNADALNEIMERQLTFAIPFKKVCIIYSYSESVLIPFSLYNSSENDAALNLIHGDLHSDMITLTDLITERETYNTYRIPASVIKVMASHFPNAEASHQFSGILRKDVAPAGDSLMLIFYSQKITVSLRKNMRTEYINSFYYQNPEDVSYHLLNICKQYNAENVSLEVYGFIEKNSVLFNELYKYFDPVIFAQLPTDYNYKEEILQYPSHYFSHLFGTSSCE